MKKIILTFVSTVIGMLLIFIFIFPKNIPTDPDIIAFGKSRALRELLTPITFTLREKIYAIKTNDRGGQTKRFCKDFQGTAFTNKNVGYFITNDHNISLSREDKDECLLNLSKKENIPVSEVEVTGFEIEYTLTNSVEYSFPVKVEHSFPEIDMAVLRVSEKEIDIIKNWKYVPFRTEAIDVSVGEVIVVDGKVSPLKDEPVVTMGAPLGLAYTLTKGVLGNNIIVNEEKIRYLHFIAPLNGGNSGGALVSLLDNRIIGMSSCVMKDNGVTSLHSGAISFKDMEKALKSIGLE